MDEDERYLRLAGEVLDQIDAVLDLWYGFVAANSHLVYSNGQPNSDYLIPQTLRSMDSRHL